MAAIGHRFDEIEAELDALTELRDKPAGTVRITSGDNVLQTVLLPTAFGPWPAWRPFRRSACDAPAGCNGDQRPTLCGRPLCGQVRHPGRHLRRRQSQPVTWLRPTAPPRRPCLAATC
jgi:hypothetical protein